MLEDASKACGDTLEACEQEKPEKVDAAEPAGEPPDQELELPMPSSPTSLKRHLRKAYGRRPMELVSRYFRSLHDLATFANNETFLSRCRDLQMVPPAYRVECRGIKNTQHVIRILDKCSYRLMLADLEYNKVRKVQVSRLLEIQHEKLKMIMTEEDLHYILMMSKEKYENVFEATRDEQRGAFAQLLREYEIRLEEDAGSDNV
ncbi:uncharacterized protein LOC144114804 [Amblyomma americanum]